MDVDPPAPDLPWMCSACGHAIEDAGSAISGETPCSGCGSTLSCLVLNRSGPRVVKVLGPVWKRQAWDEIERIGSNPDEPWLTVDIREVEQFSEEVYLNLILAKAQRFLAAKGSRWRIRGASDDIREAFRQLKLDQVFELE